MSKFIYLAFNRNKFSNYQQFSRLLPIIETSRYIRYVCRSFSTTKTLHPVTHVIFYMDGVLSCINYLNIELFYLMFIYLSLFVQI